MDDLLRCQATVTPFIFVPDPSTSSICKDFLFEISPLFSVVSSFLGIIPTYLNISYQKREKARKGEGREIFHCYLSNKSVCAAVTSTLLDNLHQPMLCAGQYLTSYLSYLKHFLQLKPVMPPLSPICYFTDHIIFVSFADTLYLLSLLNQCLSILSAHKNHLVSF